MRAPASGRWPIAWAGSAVMLLVGTIYSWGIFTQPLQVAFQWDLTTTTWTYAIANFSLAAVGTLLGGFWQDRVGPRKVAMLGIGLWGCGNLLAGFGTPTFGAPWLYLTYGLIGGVGAGMAYVAPLAMVAKWFPDRRGLAGGLVAGGFGLGAFINQCIPRLAGFHAAVVHAGNYIAARSAAQAAGIPFDHGAFLPGSAGGIQGPRPRSGGTRCGDYRLSAFEGAHHAAVLSAVAAAVRQCRRRHHDHLQCGMHSR